MLLSDFYSEYKDEASCRTKIKELRESEGITCKKCGCKSHSWKKDLKAPHNLDGLDLDALVEVSFHKTYFLQILVICFLHKKVSFEYFHSFQRCCL